MGLGAVQSKCEHVANALLPPLLGKRLLEVYLVKGVQATTAIEGNTLSEEEIRERIEGKKSLSESKEYQGQEIDNIVGACNEIADRMIAGEDDVDITPERIRRFNDLVLKNLPSEEGVVPGQIRRYSVAVADYRAAPAEDCPYLLDRLCEWLAKLRAPKEKDRIAFAVMRAILAHLYIAWIHPFGDGNGRTARLIEFQILLGAGVPTVAAHLLSNHYNQTRSEYYRLLSQASRSKGNVLPFIDYAVQGLFDQLNDQIDQIRVYQREITWRDYVCGEFRGKKTIASHRQRALALRLGRIDEPVEVGEVRRLSAELAELYASKTIKTVTRDLNALVEMELVSRDGRLVRASRHRLNSLLPRRRDQSKWT
jgi:Fic family protein